EYFSMPVYLGGCETNYQSMRFERLSKWAGETWTTDPYSTQWGTVSMRWSPSIRAWRNNKISTHAPSGWSFSGPRRTDWLIFFLSFRGCFERWKNCVPERFMS